MRIWLYGLCVGGVFFAFLRERWGGGVIVFVVVGGEGVVS